MFSSIRGYFGHPYGCRCNVCMNQNQDRYINTTKQYPNIQPIESSDKFKIVVILDKIC